MWSHKIVNYWLSFRMIMIWLLFPISPSEWPYIIWTFPFPIEIECTKCEPVLHDEQSLFCARLHSSFGLLCFPSLTAKMCFSGWANNFIHSWINRKMTCETTLYYNIVQISFSFVFFFAPSTADGRHDSTQPAYWKRSLLHLIICTREWMCCVTPKRKISSLLHRHPYFFVYLAFGWASSWFSPFHSRTIFNLWNPTKLSDNPCAPHR